MVPSVKLCDGRQMPIIGLGTEKGSHEEIRKAIDWALETGYRHIDTAYLYQNESAIGGVLESWIDSGKVKREELFITSKLPMIGNSPYKVKDFLNKTLEDLKLDYIDLYLIHFPVGFVTDDANDLYPKDSDGKLKIDEANYPLSIWKAMENEVEDGKIKSIGLSNFNAYQIDRIVEHAKVYPANLQVEMNAYFQQTKLRCFCEKRGITVSAYAPLGSPERATRCAESSSEPCVEPPKLLEDETVNAIAKAHSKTPAQVLLRHLVQLGVTVLPGSTEKEQIAENFKIFDFELNEEEIKRLNELDKGYRTFFFDEFPGIREHRDYPFRHDF